MDWNDFNRELQNRVGDPKLRYMLGLMYERILDQSKQLDACAELITQLANAVQGTVGLHEVLDDRLKMLNRHITGRESGISVESEPLTNED